VPLLATYGDATAFEMRTLGEGAAGDGGRPLLFDRVLCDVPCGGDGTLRKSPLKLSRWSVAAGLGAHALQLAILLRGAALLRPGGRLACPPGRLPRAFCEPSVHLLQAGGSCTLRARSTRCRRGSGGGGWRVVLDRSPLSKLSLCCRTRQS